MKTYLSVIFVATLAGSIQAQATIIGKTMKGAKAQSTYLTLTKACGNSDQCNLSGAGHQRVRSLGPIYVECSILTADVGQSIETASAKKFTCTFNVQ